MAYNLTETQKDLLKWLVEEVQAGRLDEEEFWFSWSADGTGLIGYKHGRGSGVPQVKQNTVRTVAQSGLLSCQMGRHDAKCTLTKSAYEAVESDFAEPEAPEILEVIPLANVEHLDEELWERCRYSISAASDDPKAWDKAVRTATTVLEDRLRGFGAEDLDDLPSSASGIVNSLFGSGGPWKDVLGESKSRSYRDLYAGAVGVFRNPYAHQTIDPTPQEGGAIISFIDLLLKMLEELSEQRTSR